jgi:glutamate-ammonia-ligase adenylyltransferase
MTLAPGLAQLHVAVVGVAHFADGGVTRLADATDFARRQTKGGEGAWDLKQAPGGLVDIEFIAQALQLIHAAKHPEIVSTETETVRRRPAVRWAPSASGHDALFAGASSLDQLIRSSGCVDVALQAGRARDLGQLARVPAETARLRHPRCAHVRETGDVRKSFEGY